MGAGNGKKQKRLLPAEEKGQIYQECEKKAGHLNRGASGEARVCTPLTCRTYEAMQREGGARAAAVEFQNRAGENCQEAYVSGRGD